MACNICGGRQFEDGPGGRKSPFTHKAPRCLQCGSLERHRFIRGIWNRMLEDEFDNRVIQFSEDRAVESDWFKSFEVSIFGRRNSLNLQTIERPDGAYDIAICNHVLEHVEQDRQAFRELMRILKPDGFLQFSVPFPQGRVVTEDWGYPKPELHQHYRVYGRDLVERFTKAQPGVHILEVPGEDEVTSVPDFVYFASFDERRLDTIRLRLERMSRA